MVGEVGTGGVAPGVAPSLIGAQAQLTPNVGVQVAEGMAEWLHARVRSELGIGPAQGRRYSWGYPACPDQSEHEKVFELLDAPSIGLSLSGGYAVEPEQSTLAIVAHHPQAAYFGMKSGRLSDKPQPDAIIADPEGRRGHRIVDGEVVFFDALPDEDPAEEGDEAPAAEGGSGEAYDASRAEAIADK